MYIYTCIYIYRYTHIQIHTLMHAHKQTHGYDTCVAQMGAGRKDCSLSNKWPQRCFPYSMKNTAAAALTCNPEKIEINIKIKMSCSFASATCTISNHTLRFPVVWKTQQLLRSRAILGEIHGNNAR